VAVRTYRAPAFGLPAVLAKKGLRRVSVCVPARNEERTIEAVIGRAVLPHFGPGGSGLVDELIVVDDGSDDATAALAQGAGARVLTRRPGGDKGAAMAAAFEESQGDVVVFLDADVENANEGFVPRLVGPLLAEEAVLVKAFYERPLNGQPSGAAG